jgi:anti-anti-sigma regulatory factor
VARGNGFLAHGGSGSMVIKVGEDVEFDAIARLRNRVEPVCARAEGGDVVVVDVTGCFVSLAGIRMLAQLTRDARGRGVRVVIAGLSGVWDKALPAAGLESSIERVGGISEV